MLRPTLLLAASLLATGPLLPLPPLAAAEPPRAVIEPIPGDEAAAQIARRARLIVTVDPSGELRAAARDQSAGPAEPPIKADDPMVQAVLRMLGLDRPTRFALVAVQNPQCVKICELIGGDYICRKVCN
ncbi:MAG: hypothetical protein NZ555_05295 [Geminicoccaceae bacterium]|nr:hypothetical protein [Geminicoccaceae bacterium]MCX8101756.1 hypothetical protein [Geminicoccaceae bacterium]MDW8371295.1 hypothetical protein [Geminicoccaceae bacterium]